MHPSSLNRHTRSMLFIPWRKKHKSPGISGKPVIKVWIQMKNTLKQKEMNNLWAKRKLRHIPIIFLEMEPWYAWFATFCLLLLNTYEWRARACCRLQELTTRLFLFLLFLMWYKVIDIPSYSFSAINLNFMCLWTA